MSKEAAKQQEEANIIASTISVIAISYMKYTTYQFKVIICKFKFVKKMQDTSTDKDVSQL